MTDNTAIEWTDATWNPLRGCSRVSEGCRNCYAESVAHRFSGPGRPYDGLTRIVNGRPTWTGEIRLVPELLDQPLRWKRPRRIFVNSMSDLFHERVPDDFIRSVFATMAAARWHTFQVLTKRPTRMRALLKLWTEEGAVLPNVWLGVSVEDQQTADDRIPLLLDTPAAVRWISAEPLLGPIDLYPSAYLPCPNAADGLSMDPSTGDYECCRKCDFTGVSDEIGIDWVVAGGESGQHARATHPEWFRSLRDQCKTADVPFLFKQWGEWVDERHAHLDQPIATRLRKTVSRLASDGTVYPMRGPGPESYAGIYRVGKKAAGRLLDGVLHDAYPEAT